MDQPLLWAGSENKLLPDLESSFFSYDMEDYDANFSNLSPPPFFPWLDQLPSSVVEDDILSWQDTTKDNVEGDSSLSSSPSSCDSGFLDQTWESGHSDTESLTSTSYDSSLNDTDFS